MLGAVMLHREHGGEQFERNVLSARVFRVLQKLVDEMSVVGVKVFQQPADTGVLLQRYGKRLAILVELLDKAHDVYPPVTSSTPNTAGVAWISADFVARRSSAIRRSKSACALSRSATFISRILSFEAAVIWLSNNAIRAFWLAVRLCKRTFTRSSFSSRCAAAAAVHAL